MKDAPDKFKAQHWTMSKTLIWIVGSIFVLVVVAILTFLSFWAEPSIIKPTGVLTFSSDPLASINLNRTYIY